MKSLKVDAELMRMALAIMERYEKTKRSDEYEPAWVALPYFHANKCLEKGGYESLHDKLTLEDHYRRLISEVED